MMRMPRCPYRIHSHLQTAVRTILESDRTGQSRGELTVHLAFRSARSDRAPTDDVGYVLRRDHVEIFDTRGNTDVVQFEQQLPGDLQSVIDLEAAVQMRVVDQALPSNGRTRLL